ncbi:amidohydrolase family protein [Fulvivirga aurantia]|uniref:amidohydrolase family protein n=1 Tax=Fulvivirga aurantia TaxID=2529383 RepID=UPI0031B57C47
MKTLLKALPILLAVAFCACEDIEEKTADLIIQGGTIYTMNDEQPTAEAIGVVDNKIVFVGSMDEAAGWVSDKTKLIDLNEKTLTPGFIEGHGHFMGLGYNELNLNLLNVKSYDEFVQKVKEAAEKAEPGQWITGRGWHQSKWTPAPEMIDGFPPS